MKNNYLNMFLMVVYISMLGTFGLDGFMDCKVINPVMRILGLILLLTIFLCFYVPYCLRIQKDNRAVENANNGGVVEPEEKKPEPEPKETTRRIITTLILVNNKTDVRYTIESEPDNQFGLSWSVIDSESRQQHLLCINQKDEESRDGKFHAKGRFYDFSVYDCIWKTIDIIDEKKEAVK